VRLFSGDVAAPVGLLAADSRGGFESFDTGHDRVVGLLKAETAAVSDPGDELDRCELAGWSRAGSNQRFGLVVLAGCCLRAFGLCGGVPR
jgi:hypothetical protein